MRILITGANGFIGARLSFYLKKKGFQVVKFSRKNLQEKNFKNKFKGVDILINCVGVDINNSKNLRKTKKANYQIPLRLFNLANEANINYFILLSTFHVYKQIIKKKINELSKLQITNNYNKTKILCERKLLKIKNKKTKLLIIRSCNLFGYPLKDTKNCHKLLINNIILSIVKNKKFLLSSSSDQSRNFSSLESFCLFIFNLIKKLNLIKFNNNSFICNYTTNFNLRLSEVLSLILNYFKGKEKLIDYKYPNFFKKKIIYNFESLYQKNIKKIKDDYFFVEIKKLIKYYKNKK